MKPIVFILGISARSGTNYLFDLLSLHPGCLAAPIIFEDYVFFHADLLRAYARETISHWRSKTPREGYARIASENNLCLCLGEGIRAYLLSQLSPQERDALGERMFVTKTPGVVGLSEVFRFFPDARVILVIRDGRSVVESSRHLLQKGFDCLATGWNWAAGEVLRFQRDYQGRADQFRIVRYEDIFRDVEGEMRKIFQFLGLDAECYDYGRARTLPIRGSSFALGDGKTEIHWVRVPRPADFDPIERWSGWSRAEHERFKWFAGRHQLALGYELKEFPAARWRWALWNAWQNTRHWSGFKALCREIGRRFRQGDWR